MTTAAARPAAHVGIVGAGQLARMTLQAAIPLGLRVRVLANRPDDSAALVAPDVAIGSPADPDALAAFASGCQVVTFDHELVPYQNLAALEAAGHCLRPAAATMALAQDKRRQRETFARLGLPIPAFRILSQPDEVAEFGEVHGWPVVVKAGRGGYDGRGVWMAGDADEAHLLVARLLDAGTEAVVEQWVPIEREVAILIARRPGGETAVYPLVETVQVGGICHELIAPATATSAMVETAADIARAIADDAGVVGILAVELFVSEGRLLVNEIATRPHNSGHYTIEGCITSQFEQHLRAVLDWPLGATALTAPAVVTVNVLGGPTGADPFLALPEALAIEGVHVHLYGKGPRPGRKLGHVTVCGDDVGVARSRARAAAAILGGAPGPLATKG